MDIHGYSKKIEGQIERLGRFRDGSVAIDFLNHIRARGLSEGRVFSYACRLPSKPFLPLVLPMVVTAMAAGAGAEPGPELELVPPFLLAEAHGVRLPEAKDEVYNAYEEVGKGYVRWYDPRHWFERFGMPDKLGEAIVEAEERMGVYQDVASLKPLESKYSLVICSTVTEWFLGAWAPKLSLNISTVFSAVSDFGMVTKDELLYRRVAEALGVSPGEVVHVATTTGWTLRSRGRWDALPSS